MKLKLVVADVLDVLQRAGVEVVDADHPVALAEQVVAHVRAEEARSAADQAGAHRRRGYPGPLPLGDSPVPTLRGHRPAAGLEGLGQPVVKREKEPIAGEDLRAAVLGEGRQYEVELLGSDDVLRL